MNKLTLTGAVGMLAGLVLAAGSAWATDTREDQTLEIDEVELADAEARPERVYITGSRIPRDPDSIRSQRHPMPGVIVYQREELERTGEATTGAALRKVDPRMR